jgi:hypothetical protein
MASLRFGVNRLSHTAHDLCGFSFLSIAASRLSRFHALAL